MSCFYLAKNKTHVGCMYLPKSGLCGCEDENGSGNEGGEGVSLPTLDNPASAEHILNGYESYDSSGEKIAGSMPVNGTVNKELTPGDSYTIPKGYHDGKSVVWAKVVEGEETNLPQLTNAAAAKDIVEGKEAIDQYGVKITGNVMECESGYLSVLSNATPEISSSNFIMTGTVAEDRLMRAGAKVRTSVAASSLGSATTADVKEGVTFTSKKGVRLTGTAKVGTGTVTSETFTNTDRDAYGYPALSTIQAKKGRTLWKDMFVCVNSIYVEPNADGQSKEHNLSISYDSTTGVISMEVYRMTNYLWNFGAYSVTVYYID